jgi:hypothetical protein
MEPQDGNALRSARYTGERGGASLDMIQLFSHKRAVHSILGLIRISVRLILHQTLGHVLFHQFFQVRH